MNQLQSNPEIVHLVAAPGSGGSQLSIGRTIPTVLCQHAMANGLTPPGHVVLVGDSSSEHQARLLGLDWDQRLCPPLGKVKLLRRRIKQITQNATRVICWNDELVCLLNHLSIESDLISTSPASAPPHISKRINIRAFEQTDCDYWIERGYQCTLDTLLPPLLDNIADSNRPVDRSSIGVTSNTICIGVVADRPSDVDARELAFLFGLLNAAGYSISGIVPDTAGHLDAARRHHRGLGSRFQFLVSGDPISTLLPAFDALLHPCFDGSGSSILIERMCENADVPVLRLKESQHAGLSRAPAMAGPIIEYFDELIRAKQSSESAKFAHAQ